MTEQWSVPAWVLLATLVALLAVLAAVTLMLVRVRSRTTAALAAARTDADALRDQVAAIERRLATPEPRVDDHEYVITMLGEADETPSPPAPVVPGPLFADLVLRESVVQAASLAAGLRRALTHENRHRIRFEMKREVKRARKQRRADQRQARREFEARQRAAA
jgi:hypothetical protein